MEDVGKELRIMKSYLQQPSHVDQGVEYDNPHYFKIEGQKTPWVDAFEEETSFSQALTNVLEYELTHKADLCELEAPASIVQTPLLTYVLLFSIY